MSYILGERNIWSKIMKYRSMIIFVFFMLGCQGSSDLEMPRTTTQNEKPKAEVKDKSSESASYFNEEGLLQLQRYLELSQKAYEESKALGQLMSLLKPYYYHNSANKKEKPYLKGNASDPIGKFIRMMTEERFFDEADRGLLLIIRDKTFFQELIEFFMSKDFVGSEDDDDGINILPLLTTAIEKKDPKSIEQHVMSIHVNFIQYFGKYYHSDSQWTQKPSGEFEFKKSGWNSRDKVLMQMLGALRQPVAQCITSFIMEYFKSPSKKFH